MTGMVNLCCRLMKISGTNAKRFVLNGQRDPNSTTLLPTKKSGSSHESCKQTGTQKQKSNRWRIKKKWRQNLLGGESVELCNCSTNVYAN